jgi:HAD superfamily hydrolase (TIGR01509 family)
MYEKAIKAFLSKKSVSCIDLKAVLFDMDGVLYDSMPIHAVAWTQTLIEMGLNFSEEEAYLHEGRTGSGTINIVFQREFGRNATEEEIQKIYQRKSSLFDNSEEALPMPGALELLEKVKMSDLERIIVTGSGQKKLLTKLNKNFPGHFSKSKMVTAYDVVLGKPNPEPYLIGLKKADISDNEAVVIENAPLGVESAKAAGIFTIAVNTGKLEDKYLIDAGADLLFGSMKELSDDWENLLDSFNRIKK